MQVHSVVLELGFQQVSFVGGHDSAHNSHKIQINKKKIKNHIESQFLAFQWLLIVLRINFTSLFQLQLPTWFDLIPLTHLLGHSYLSHWPNAHSPQGLCTCSSQICACLMPSDVFWSWTQLTYRRYEPSVTLIWCCPLLRDSRTELLHLSTADILGQLTLSCGGCSVYSRMLAPSLASTH